MNEDKLDGQLIAKLTTAGFDVKNVGKNSFVIVPEGYYVCEIDPKNELLDEPLRQKGFSKMFDKDSFVAFLNAQKNDRTLLICNDDSFSFKGIFNAATKSGEKGWCDYGVVYSCPLAREFKIWDAYDQKRLQQSEFAEFLENNKDNIIGDKGYPSAVQMLEVALNFQANTNVQFSSGTRLQDGSIQLTFNEKVEAGAGAKGNLKVPEKFLIGIPVLKNGVGYKIEANLRYRINGGTLVIWYELVNLDKVKETAFNDVRKEIESATSMTALVGSID